MPTLLRAFVDYDLDLLRVIADLWDIDLVSDDRGAAAEELAADLSQAEAVLTMWSHLGEEEQKALHDLQIHEGRIPFTHFTRRYGELRPMGPARRERERPWLNPTSITETLYYRGLIVRAFEQALAGAQEHIVIPSEFQEYLPQPDPASVITAPGYAVAPPRRVEAGLGTGVDDVATLLAYLLIRDENAREWLTRNPVEHIDRHLRRPTSPAYRTMLTSLLYDTELAADEEFLTKVTTVVNKDMSRPWLEAPRLHQMRALSEAWMTSLTWNELSFTPGLDADQWPNDPRLARQVVIDTLRDVPVGIWWSTDGFVEHIKQVNPDFQRPGGDYASWYLRDAYTAEILHGFQYWDYIEGGIIRFILEGPMRWLGLVRTGSGAFIVTPLGAALTGSDVWPSDADAAARASIDDQGVVSTPASMGRYERVQLARFTSWVSAPVIPLDVPGRAPKDESAYQYQVTPQALARVASEGISIPSHILPFLQRVTGHNVPANVVKMLEAWHTSPAEIVVQDVVIVRAKDLGVFERMRNNPRISKWLVQQVGPQAFAVQRENVAALLSALRSMGVLPLFEAHDQHDWP
jgi:hypothetical protein